MTVRRRCVRAVSGALVLSAATAMGVAVAEPPGMPDVDAMTDVTPDYTQRGTRSPDRVAVFLTPDGLTCNASWGSAACLGALPGIADRPLIQGGDGPCDLGVASMSPGAGMMSHYKGACPGPRHGKVLHPGQKVSIEGITCGVADADMTVCTSGAHGFVLQPSGSFPF